jgi:hypothetical protein
MKLYSLALALLATVAVAQTPAPKPVPPSNTSVLDAPITLSSSGLLAMNFANTMKEGCSQYFGQLDAKRNLCKQSIEFIGMGQVSCSKAHKINGAWTITCWYKPNVPPSAKEGK